MNQDLMVFSQEIIYLNTILLKKIKDGACIINLEEYADVGTHWIALFFLKNEIASFDNFCVEHISEEIKRIY